MKAFKLSKKDLEHLEVILRARIESIDCCLPYCRNSRELKTYKKEQKELVDIRKKLGLDEA